MDRSLKNCFILSVGFCDFYRVVNKTKKGLRNKKNGPKKYSFYMAGVPVICQKMNQAIEMKAKIKCSHPGATASSFSMFSNVKELIILNNSLYPSSTYFIHKTIQIQKGIKDFLNHRAHLSIVSLQLLV